MIMLFLLSPLIQHSQSIWQRTGKIRESTWFPISESTHTIADINKNFCAEHVKGICANPDQEQHI